MSTLELLARKKRDLLKAAAHHRALNLRVFGSVAGGEVRPDSDIDFLVDFAPEASLLDLVGLQQEIESILGRRAEVVTSESVSPFLRESIVRGVHPL